MSNFPKPRKWSPKYPHKYVGDIRNIVQRSQWETKFLNWCDNNPNVLKYASEELVVEYYQPVDNRMHRYFVDFLIEYVDQNGNKKKAAIEIKPAVQTIPPKQNRNKKRFIEESMTYAVNTAKWKAATAFCSKRNIEFKIITEYELGLKK